MSQIIDSVHPDSTPTPVSALAAGYSIIPVRLDKKPRYDLLPKNTKGKATWKPFQERQPHPDEFVSWEKASPTAYAIVTGRISGTVTFDFDGAAGRRLAAEWGIRPHRKTGNDGLHWDVRYPGHYVPTLNGKAKESLGRRWPGLDVKGDGGYAIAFGRNEDGPYEWLRDIDPDPPELVPPEIWQFLQEYTSRPGAPSGNGQAPPVERLVRMALDKIPHTGRNSAGLWLTCQLRDGRYDKEAARSALRKYQAQCPDTNAKGNPEAYTDAEIEATLEQVYGHPARDPWETQPRSVPLNGAAPAAEQHAGQEEEREEDNDSFAITDQGVFHTHYERDKSTNTVRPVIVYICSPLWVLAYARDPNSEAWGLLLKWTDADKEEHFWICPMRLLVGDGLSFREILSDAGLQIGSAPKALLPQYVMSRRPQRRITCVPQVGWLDRCFVTPEWIIPAGADVGYQSAGRGEHYYRTSGTLDEWRDNISKPCRGNSRLIFAMSAAFAGPILRPLNIQGGGFHYRSTSSYGKSTAQLVAGSIWGGGGRLGWARSWSATKNAYESIAELHNDSALILDEIQAMNPRDLQETIYMLANGFGKGRETRNMTGRRTLQWLCMILSNGERPIADMVAEAGKKIRGGADIRLATIPADAGAGMGIFEKLPEGITDPRVFSETLEAAARQYYGTAIQPFIEGWRKDWDRFVQEANEFLEAFIVHNLPAGAAPEVRRVLRRFAAAACAGEFATEYGITGWNEDDATEAAITCFQAWLEERGGVEATDMQNALEMVRECIATQHARFRAADPRDKEPNIPNQLGFWKHVKEELVYLIDPGKFRTEVCPGYHAPDVARYLKSKGFLLLNDNDRHLTAKVQLTLATGDTEVRRLYAVRAKILEVLDVDLKKGGEF